MPSKYRKVFQYAEDKLTGKQPLYVNAECGMQNDTNPSVTSGDTSLYTREAGRVQSEASAPDRFILFTTKTCPKCRMAKMFLDQAGIAYEAVLAEENADLAREYSVKEAPTLVVLSGEMATVISNPSNIKAYVDGLKVKA